MKLNIGLEKENLVFTKDFKARNYKKEELIKNVTLDFSNNQIELVSDVFDNVDDLIKQMYSCLNNDLLINENIWPLSYPGINDYEIKYDALGGESYNYRKKLSQKYELDFMNISGIHFNVSLQKEVDNSQEYYFNLMKKIYMFAPLILQFVSFSPFVQKGILDDGLENIGNNKGLKNSISLRNSLKYGYINEDRYDVDFSSYKTYKKSINSIIEDKIIIDKREIYSKVRLKEIGDNVYLELRFVDLNPFYRLGISVDILNLLCIFIKYLDSLNIDEIDVIKANENFEKVATQGRDKSIVLNINNKNDTLKNHTLNLLKEFLAIGLTKREEFVINDLIKKYSDNDLDIDRFINLIEESKMSLKEYGIINSFTKENFVPLLQEYDLELSTKILINQAIKESYHYNVLDEFTNTIEISKKNQKELIVQATKTNADTYANILMLENKYMTKKILFDNNIKVPMGQYISKKNEVNYSLFKDYKMVIKPVDTNFGLGISILEKGSSKKDIDKALELAFSYSKKVIIEEFFEGQELRFLIIDGKLVSIVKRTPANVIGNGIDTIEELVNKKNKSSLRSKGYITPLEKIQITEYEENFLYQKGLDKNYIPNDNEVIYLRENSNISTGGDSEEIFDEISEYYKDISIKATKAMGVSICGIDMIVSNDMQDYVIIEANFNPAIQMHTYPFLGIGKNVASDILGLLFKNEEK